MQGYSRESVRGVRPADLSIKKANVGVCVLVISTPPPSPKKEGVVF